MEKLLIEKKFASSIKLRLHKNAIKFMTLILFYYELMNLIFIPFEGIKKIPFDIFFGILKRPKMKKKNENVKSWFQFQ